MKFRWVLGVLLVTGSLFMNGCCPLSCMLAGKKTSSQQGQSSTTTPDKNSKGTVDKSGSSSQ